MSIDYDMESAAGTYTSLYTITSSPNAKFPQDIIVYNISRTDNYENIPYDAYRTQHNFEKQGCPEVCERGRTDNKFAAGCPSGYESFQTPLKKSFYQQHDLKFAGGGVLIIDKVTTVEAHVADIYDQQMEIFISSVLKFKLVTLEKTSERHGQNVFTDLEDRSNEIEEEEISKLYGYSNLTLVEKMANKLLQDSAEIVAKADLKSVESNLLGEEIMILRKLLTFLRQLGLRHIEETVVKYNELPQASDVDKIKRQIWLDILPLIGTRESVSFIVNVIQENINKPEPGISLWEASSLLGALPQNIYRISDRILLDLSHSLTSSFGIAIAGNNSGTRFLKSPSRDFPFLPESFQLSCQVIYSQFGLAIHQNDHQARRRFVEWAQNEIAVVPDFHKRILVSDEAHFWLNGYVNKQNCRIWSEANPQVYVETPLHPEKLTVWCALWAGGIIGPYFFKNDESHKVTVNGDRYRAMITNFFIPELNNHDVQELWFQQDGATCHTARATIDLLKDTFGDRFISRFGPVNWRPRSCDLRPLDYFLWDYVKSLVYADKPQTLDHLEDNIRRVIADIRPQMLEKVIENWTYRLDYIRASRGSHMPEIMFKM
ncbi:transposable element Tc3 transposase [Trichonephila clavipes]|nr:transposable element Tc3 transposase [Trichonephila clavipes]